MRICVLFTGRPTTGRHWSLCEEDVPVLYQRLREIEQKLGNVELIVGDSNNANEAAVLLEQAGPEAPVLAINVGMWALRSVMEPVHLDGQQRCARTGTRPASVRRFAAAWTAIQHPDGTFNYPDHMRRVRRGDMIFMYANGLGVIAIGRAAESRLEVIFPDHPDRLRDFATEGENVEEWRIPVEWLVWEENHPCEVESLRSSFQEITEHAARIQEVRQHFAMRRQRGKVGD